jgi:very-short-patch-repair endonuclease
MTLKLPDPMKSFARRLRSELTPAEKILWRHLRGSRFMHLKWRRQRPIEPYVADFACMSLMLIVELDGESHLTSEIRHAKRTVYLEERGWMILRFWNTAIFDEIESVLERIWQVCQERASKVVSRARQRERD